MRKLPHMKYSDGITRQTQVRFGGYNHSKYAKDGEIYDMQNITARHYPLIAPREAREICRTSYATTFNSIGASDKFYTVNGGTLYYDKISRGNVGTVKCAADTGNYLFFLNTNTTYSASCFNKSTGEITQTLYDGTETQGTTTIFDSTVYYIRFGSKSIVEMTYTGAQIYNAAKAVGNGGKLCLYITLTTGTVVKTAVTVTSVSSGDNYSTNIEATEWGFDDKEVSKVRVIAGVPSLQFVCGTDNRIWGCDDKNIYCSAFGKPMEWFNYEASSSGNVSDNSWSIEPFDSGGDFTGCTVYKGTPIFFKEDMVYEVYGDNPGNFKLQTYKVPGVAKGAHKSVQVIKDILYYLSPEGIVRYSGGIVDNLSTEFYEQLEEGVAGNDGARYYISAKADGAYKLFVYDIKNRVWCVEDDTQVLDFALYNRRLYMLKYVLNGSPQLVCINPGTHTSPISKSSDDATPEGVIEFADCYIDSVDKKAISKIFTRFSIEDGGELEILIDYDSSNVWESVKKISASSKKTYTLPIIPKRCDHFRIKIKGKKFVLYALSYEYYNGSTL